MNIYPFIHRQTMSYASILRATCIHFLFFCRWGNKGSERSKTLACHTASKWQSWDWNPGLSDSFDHRLLLVWTSRHNFKLSSHQIKLSTFTHKPVPLVSFLMIQTRSQNLPDGLGSWLSFKSRTHQWSSPVSLKSLFALIPTPLPRLRWIAKHKGFLRTSPPWLRSPTCMFSLACPPLWCKLL